MDVKRSIDSSHYDVRYTARERAYPEGVWQVFEFSFNLKSGKETEKEREKSANAIDANQVAHKYNFYLVIQVVHTQQRT